jgi:outer membrane protein TolC
MPSFRFIQTLVRFTCIFSLLSAPADASEEKALTLEAAITSALQNNLSYRIAELDPEIAREAVIQRESVFETELFATGRVAQSEQSTTFSQTTGTSSDNRSLDIGARKQLDYGTSITAQTNLDRRDSNAGVNTSSLSQGSDFSVSVRQPLLRGFGSEANRAGINSAVAGLTAANAALRNQVEGILEATEKAYWNVARLQEQLDLDESSLKVAETLLEEARERERVGVATRIEVLQAEAEKARRLEQIIETRRLLGDAMDQLLLSMGTISPDNYDSGNEQPVSALSESAQPLPEFSMIWRDALGADPDLRQQEAIIDQRNYDRIAARDANRPSLDLVLSGGFTGIDSDKAENAVENALNQDGHVWSMGVEFSMPWRQTGTKSALRASEKRLQQANLRYEELKQSLFREVRAVWRNFASIGQSLEAARVTVSLQEATFEREMTKYEEGLSAFREVQEAQRDLDQARIRYLQAKFNQLAVEIELDRLTGKLMSRHGITAPANP